MAALDRVEQRSALLGIPAALLTGLVFGLLNGGLIAGMSCRPSS